MKEGLKWQVGGWAAASPPSLCFPKKNSCCLISCL